MTLGHIDTTHLTNYNHVTSSNHHSTVSNVDHYRPTPTLHAASTNVLKGWDCHNSNVHGNVDGHGYNIGGQISCSNGQNTVTVSTDFSHQYGGGNSSNYSIGYTRHF